MSIRIQNDTVAGAGSPAVTSAGDAYSGAPSSGKAFSGRGSDRVDISPLSQVISEAGIAHQAQQAQRVSQLAALYRSGRYNVDSTSVSHAIVSQALAASAGENS